MSLYCRNSVWYISFTTPDGKRVRCSSFTSDKRAAQELHDQLKADAWRIARLGEKPRRTWKEAVVRFLKETRHKASHKDDVQRLSWADRFLGQLYLDEITRDVFDQITEAKLAEGVGPATVNRVLGIVRSVMRRAAHEWEWIDRVPKFRLLKEPKGRTRWLTREEAEKLAWALPGWLSEPYRFALYSGLRQRNVLGLRWDQVDLDREVAWIHAHQAKAGKPIGVPLVPEAVAVLRRQRGKHSALCFTRDGKRITQVSTSTWMRALKRAGLGREACWHVATRHTWASWMVQAGVPLATLQELGSWKTPSVVKRYAHLSPEHLREYANRISRPLVTVASQ